MDASPSVSISSLLAAAATATIRIETQPPAPKYTNRSTVTVADYLILLPKQE